MNKYVITFSKTGIICYTSHLDMMKLFKRSFKRAGIRLSYSQGFNPHPKMGFAQPLSLGYEGMAELLEFEAEESLDCDYIKEKMQEQMPEGLRILGCHRGADTGRTLAARTYAASYSITIPADDLEAVTGGEIRATYMRQDQIKALKKQKKKKEPAEVDIKPMIRDISMALEHGNLRVEAMLDSGSTSNLSPELVISTLLDTLKMDVDRSRIHVTRKEILTNTSL